MEINLIETLGEEQIFEYKFPDFLNENNKIGNSEDDFEVLQVLGNGTFGKVLKVKSKKNQEIYAMKKVDKNMIKNNYKAKYFENEKIILSKLQSPLVCKCLSYFEDKDKNFIYYVMEFMNNGDLLSYYEANKKLSSHIPEDKLCELFFKCISSLLYIHNQGIIHRDIKLQNIFLDDNFNIKIGDFNVSATINIQSAENFTNIERESKQMVSNNSILGSEQYMAPEVEELDKDKRKYDQKADVFSMGISFFKLAYNDYPYPYDSGKDLRNKYYSKNLYSQEINHIIDMMIQKEKENRFTTLDAYSEIKKIYIEKYVKNSAVKSAIYCFYNFQNFRNFFYNSNNIQILLKKNKSSNNFIKDIKFEMGFSVLKLIQSLIGDDENLINLNLFDLRTNMENYGLNLKYNEEIRIDKFIFYFLKTLNSISNEVSIEENNINNPELKFLSSEYFCNNGYEEFALNNILHIYNKIILSLISRNFTNVIKTKKKCMLCNNERNYFLMTNYIPFNVKILTEKLNSYNFHIKNCFEYLVYDEKVFSENNGIICPYCNNKVTVHKEYKSFYHTAKNLIIILNREYCKDKTFIDFDEQLILSKKEVERYFRITYQLIGVIEEEEEKQEKNYISFTRCQNNLWSCNGSKDKIMNFNEIKQKGTVVALFYYCYDDNLILQSKK